MGLHPSSAFCKFAPKWDCTQWRLNLRITGCVFKSRKKGWLFFFSEIEDKKLLYELDHFVKKIVKKFGVSIELKKFIRTYYEIKHKKDITRYIPNFDAYTIDMKEEFLRVIFDFDTRLFSEIDIEREFNKKIDKQAKDLLTDVTGFVS